MKEMKTWEEQLRSWTPRRPSARLKRRLFEAATDAPGSRALIRVLLPAAACVILSVAMLNEPDHTAETALAGQGAVMTMSLSNQSYAAYLPGSFACDANRLDTFRWTNGGGFPSFTFSIAPGKANH